MMGVDALDCGQESAHWGLAKDRRPHVGIAQVQRLLPSVSAVDPERPEVRIHPGLYILSGGMGSLGLLVAGWLANADIGALWLLGRSGRMADTQNEMVLQLWQGRTSSTCFIDRTMTSRCSKLICGIIL